MTAPRHIAVLKGGTSPERDVSLVSGKAVAKALRDCGARVTEIDVGADVGLLLKALDPKPDVVFNALHGRLGEDGCIQGLLEMLRIPYTHSGVAASAIAMDKPLAKRLFAEAGLPLAEGRVVSRGEFGPKMGIGKPYVVKPLNQGSSVGVRVVFENDPDPRAEDIDWGFGETVLIEAYVPGREVHVAVMGDRALGAVEIRPKGRFYDYQAKYTAGGADHVMPAPLPAPVYAEALRIALGAHQALGCRGVSRADLRYDDTRVAGQAMGRFALLEVNTQPGMTPLSLVPEIAAHVGINFRDLVLWMVEHARCDA